MHSRVALLLMLLMAAGCVDSTPAAPLNQQASPQSPTPPTGPTQPTTPASTAVLKGAYNLTIQMPSASCIAPADRTRTYSIDIQPSAGGFDVVTLSGSRFLAGNICTYGSGRFTDVGCHQFFASTAADGVTFTLENNNDEAHGGHIVEQFSDGSWAEIIGDASGKLGQPAIIALGSASVWYCRESRSYPFPCVNFTSCSTDLRLTLTPK